MRNRTARFRGNKQPAGWHRLLLLMLCLLLEGCRADALVREPGAVSEEVSIHIASHGWHTGIIVERNALLASIPDLTQFFSDARYIEFGWGDHDFYQANEISYPLAVKALLYPTDAVLHVVGIPRHPEVYFRSSEVAEIGIQKAGFAAMLKFFRQSFKRRSHGGLMPLGRGLYADSLFFEANGTYHALYTCNSWIMEALTKAGLPEPVWPTLTAGGVMDQIARYREIRRHSR